MATAPTVPNFAQFNYQIGDTADVVIKQNGLNGALLQFGNSLSTMTASINTDLQTMEQQKTDTQQAATAADEDAQQIALDKQAVAADRTYIDQQKGIVDTNTQQVSTAAQQVATDRQAVADDRLASEQAAGASTDAATASIQAKDDAQALYSDLNAVNTAKTEAQQAATTAGEERGLAVQARQGAEAAQAASEQTVANATYMGTPVGGTIDLPLHLTGIQLPPTDSALFRYVLLTAGESATGGYNEGVLINESVSGSAPLVLATAEIADANSPINGAPINLWNTEGRFVRPGEQSGVLQLDQMQLIEGNLISLDATVGLIRGSASNITGAFYRSPDVSPERVPTEAGSIGSAGGLGFRSSGSPSARTSSTTAGETRVKNETRVYLMRIR